MRRAERSVSLGAAVEMVHEFDAIEGGAGNTLQSTGPAHGAQPFFAAGS